MDKKIVMFCLCALIAIFVIPSVIFAASFDCGKATSEIEKLICSNDELSKLDESLNEAYLRALNRTDIKEQTIESQRQWLKNERNVCQNVGCIKSAYETRIKELGFTSSYGIVIFRDPNRSTASPKAPANASKSQGIEPSEKMTQTQTEQQSDISAQNDKIFIKGCPEPILSDFLYKSKKNNELYNQAFQRGYEMGLQQGYKSKLDPEQILENALIQQSEIQQRLAWYYGWHAGRWYGVAKATGHGCTKRMSPWPIASLKIRYAFFREAMKANILNTFGFYGAVFMLSKESKPYCEKLLPDILNDENIELVEPVSKFENADHHSLANYRSCDSRSALHVYDDRGIPRSRTLSDIGTQAFRFYGDLRLSKNTIAKDVIYSESKPYFAGYSALNPQSCELSILATNSPTTFRVSDNPVSFCDNFLIKWRGKYINLEVCGDPPYVVRADSLEIREEGHTIDCNWVAHSSGAAAVNPWGGKPVLRSIIKDKTERPGSNKGRKASNKN
jgi:uncharacterized protein